MMDEARLIERLRGIEALHAGAKTPGERIAAERGRERILERLHALGESDPPSEFQFSMSDMWARKVFIALLRRYGLRPYRYRRQRRTTVMVRVPERFLDQTLWPEFEEISKTLHSFLEETTERVISQVLHQDGSEAEVVAEPRRLETGG
jgi:hypothetical protein